MLTPLSSITAPANPALGTHKKPDRGAAMEALDLALKQEQMGEGDKGQLAPHMEIALKGAGGYGQELGVPKPAALEAETRLNGMQIREASGNAAVEDIGKRAMELQRQQAQRAYSDPTIKLGGVSDAQPSFDLIR